MKQLKTALYLQENKLKFVTNVTTKLTITSPLLQQFGNSWTEQLLLGIRFFPGKAVQDL